MECHVGLTRFRDRDMSVESEVCLAVACLLCADDGIRLTVFCLENRAVSKGKLSIRMVSDGDVKHSLVITKLHLVYIKLESLRFITIARTGPNLLRPSADSNEHEQQCDDVFLVHSGFFSSSFVRKVKCFSAIDDSFGGQRSDVLGKFCTNRMRNNVFLLRFR